MSPFKIETINIQTIIIQKRTGLLTKGIDLSKSPKRKQDRPVARPGEASIMKTKSKILDTKW